METKINASQNLLWAFVKQTVQDTPSKLPATLVALLLYYVLPLLLRLDLLFSVMMIAPVIICTIVFLTQPKATPGQTKEAKDYHSMTFLIWATMISQISIVIQWAYFNTNHDFKWGLPTMGGLVLMVTGLWIRIGAIIELGKYFNNAVYIRADHELIQTGTYRYLRHGSYTGAFLVAVGIGVYFSAWWGLAATTLILGGAYCYRIIQEEKALVDHFGDTYRQYQKRTRMLIPFIL